MNGSWKKSSSEGVADLLQHLGQENHAEKAKEDDLVTVITQTGNDFKIERNRSKHSYANEFTVGVETEVNTLKEGFKAKVNSTLVDGKLTITSVDKDYQHSIEVSDGKLKEVFTVKGKSATRWSEKA